MSKNIKIGLFGFGCVGKGLIDVLQKTPGLKAEIVKICVKDKNKKRDIDSSLITFDKNEILDNPEINVIVELIDDAEEAKNIVFSALQKRKAVVTANKKFVSENFEELIYLQNKYATPVLYEAAVCASIPIVRNLEEYYDNDLLKSIAGIINGSTNYILTLMYKQGLDYETALQLARDKGYAESNPALDVLGLDAKYKLQIILAHAFGLVATPDNLFNFGITKLNKFDANYALEKGYKIKLIARGFKREDNSVVAFVAPGFVKPDSELFSVDDVFNGVVTESAFTDKIFLVGKGAGAYPTASAVLADLSALSYNYKYEYKKIGQSGSAFLSKDVKIKCYLRFDSHDKINLDLFDSVIETYSSEETSYMVGICKLSKLWEYKVNELSGISLIVIEVYKD